MQSSYLKIVLLFLSGICLMKTYGQVSWKNVDSLYQPLPQSLHIYNADSWSYDTSKFRAYYVIADLKDKKLDFTADTTLNRRLTPSTFYEKNSKPLVVVNTTFFSFETNKNLNVVVKNGKMVAYNVHTIAGKGKDTLTYRHPFGIAIGFFKNRKADIGWYYADSTVIHPFVSQHVVPFIKDSLMAPSKEYLLQKVSTPEHIGFEKIKIKTAVGGGPVLIQNGEIKITNNEELKFGGKAVDDKHPRTAMGYTKDNKLIILVVEGRNPGVADGVSLTQLAAILQQLGCVEALNLDGGGSSCLLVNGKETIKVSDKTGQRPVPAVFMIQRK